MSNTRYNFKCCQKLFSHYVCIHCYGLIHKSCISSGLFKNKVKIINGHKVNCCQPENLEESVEEKNAALEETLSELAMDTQLKNKHIERISREYNQFVNEASLREDELNKTIVQNELVIDNLKIEILKLKHELNVFTSKVYLTCETQTNVNSRNISTETDEVWDVLNRVTPSKINLKSCGVQTDANINFNSCGVQTDVKTKSSASIMTIIETSILSDSELPMQSPVDSPASSGPSRDVSRHTVNTNLICNNQSVNQNCKILIFGDKSGLNISSKLTNLLDSRKFIVEGWIKPGASLTVMSKDIFSLSKYFSVNDTVVLTLDTNVIYNLDIVALNTLLAVAKYTNLVLVLKFDVKNSDITYRRILHYINNFVSKNNASIRIIQNTGRNFVYRHTKLSLCKIIANYILCGGFQANSIVLRSLPTKKLTCSLEEELNSSCNRGSSDPNYSNSFLGQKMTPTKDPLQIS